MGLVYLSIERERERERRKRRSYEQYVGSESNYEHVSDDFDTTWHKRRRGGKSFCSSKKNERERYLLCREGRKGRKGREEGGPTTTHARGELVFRGRNLRPSRENINRRSGTQGLKQVERKGHCFALPGDHLLLQAGGRATKD